MQTGLAASVRPICILDKYGRLEVLGSCTLIRIGTTPILLTAAHVLDAVKDETPLIGGQKPVPLVGEGFRTNPNERGTDREDFLAVELAPETEQALVGVEFVELNRIDVRDSDDAMKRQCLVGYPISRHKPDRAFSRSARRLKLDPQTCSTVLHDRFDYGSLGIAPRTHHAIRFDPARMLNPAGPGLVTGPAPTGMSGGALWYFAHPINERPVFLSGILIEWHERLEAILAVKMRHILSRIAVNLPHLSKSVYESLGE